MNRSTQISVALFFAVAALSGSAYGRGFGGFGGGGFGGFHAGGFGGGLGGGLGGAMGGHAGGFEAGGFHAGGFGAGGLGAGGLGASGFHAGGFDAGGFHAGGFDTGGLGAGGFHAGGVGAEGFHAGGLGAGGFGAAGGRAGEFGAGGAVSRGQLNSFLGLPTDGGMHAAGGAFAGAGAVAGPERAAGFSGEASGHVYQGPGGTTIAHGSVAGRGAAVGPGGAVAGGGRASGTVVEGPGGNVYTHGSAGARGIAAGPEGIAAGGVHSSGTAIHGAGGTTVGHRESGAAGIAAGPGGIAAGGERASGTVVHGPGGTTIAHGSVAAGGVHYWSPTYMHSTGVAVRHTFPAYGVFTPTWYTAHPGAWYAAGLTAGAWAGATWDALNTWFGTDWPANYYDYGDNITYENNYVCYEGQPIATAEQYSQAATQLADQGQAQVSADAQWLPLGVFGLLEPGQTSATMTVQLAVDKQGIVRGNYYNTADKETLPIHGAVNKSTQRIAWTIGDNKNMVLDTGLDNLTEDQATVLVHYGTQKTAQWMMVRLKQQGQSSGKSQPSGSGS
jgi:hypothetical protein